MTDVFISYSRKDIAFARLLHEALIENGLETWIDWQDIPPSADWLAEVYEAIEGAGAFLFIISETSLASEICGLEIAHAARHNKRLIPIVIKDVDAQQVPKELAVLNWIFFDEAGEKFAEAMEDLVTAITVDQAWVKGHTRFQNRALDWERKERDHGALLRGADLSEAEAWLGGSAGKDPGPTALQTEYILKSREDATRRQRRTLMGVGAALVVAIGLGILAWTQRGLAVEREQARATAQAEAVAESEMRATAQVEAELQREVAVEQSNLATSRFLSSEALAHMENQLDLSLQLAIRAVRSAPTTAARGSLVAALSSRPYLAYILTKQNSVMPHALGLSADGMTLAVSYYRRIEIWDLTSGDLKTELSIPEDLVEYWGLRFLDSANQLLGCFSVRSDILTTSCRVWDVETGQDLGLRITDVEGSPLRIEPTLQVSPGGRLAVIADDQQNMVVFSTQEGGGVFELPVVEDAKITRTAFHPQGDLLAAGDENGKVFVWELATGKLVADGIKVLDDPEMPEVFQGVSGLVYSPDGARLLAAGNGQSVVLDAETYLPLKRITGYNSQQISASFRPDGTPVVSLKSGVNFYFWDAFTGKFLTGQPDLAFLDGMLLDAAFDPVNLRLITLSNLGSISGSNILVWDLVHHLPFERLLAADLDFETVEYSPDSTRPLLATGGCGVYDPEQASQCLEGEVIFWDPISGEQVGEPLQGHNDRIEDLAFHPDGNLLATAGRDGDIILWDLASQQPLGEALTGHDDLVETVEFSPSGDLLVSVGPFDEVSVWLWDLTQQPLTSEDLENQGQDWNDYNVLAFSPEGQTLAASGLNDNASRITLWDLASRTVIKDLEPETNNKASSAMAFSPDGDSLLTAGADGVRIWDYQAGQVLAEPSLGGMDSPGIQNIALSPDGKILAGLLLHKEIGFWDGETGQMIAPAIKIFGEESLVWEEHRIAYSPVGDQLAVVGDFGLLLWDLVLENWVAAACRMANRDLSAMEWRTFLGDRAYQETCPQDQ